MIILVYNKRFSKSNRLNDQELEDKIWENANEWISKTKLHDKVGGDKKKCFDRTLKESVFSILDGENVTSKASKMPVTRMFPRARKNVC